MILSFLLACASSPAPVPTEAAKPVEAKYDPMVMTIFHEQYGRTGTPLDETFTIWAWSGASRDASQHITWTREDPPKFTDTNDVLKVVLTSEDLDVDRFGNPWVDLNVSMDDGTVWLHQGCSSFQLGETPNLSLSLYEQVDHKGNCRAYVNGAKPTGVDKEHWIFYTHARERYP